MSMFDFGFDSSPIQVAADLIGFAGDLENMQGALEKIVTEVAIPSIRKNFEVGGRPAWPPLAEATIDQKSNPNPLFRSGTMYSNAQNRSAWDITNSEATLDGSRVTEYAAYHQTGTRKMPAREWATLQPDEEDLAEEKMVEWVAEKLGDHGFSTFASSFGSGDF